jgi:hypothetical protein
MSKSAAERVVTAPSYSFLRVSWVRVWLASYLLTLGKRKKSGWCKIRELLILNCLSALKLATRHWYTYGNYPIGTSSPFASIAGLFYFETLRNRLRASMMYWALIVLSMGA